MAALTIEASPPVIRAKHQMQKIAINAESSFFTLNSFKNTNTKTVISPAFIPETASICAVPVFLKSSYTFAGMDFLLPSITPSRIPACGCGTYA
ncbi:MAG: hypothetical protein BWY84_01013 [Candidatus Aerophobetes bacterium ADurb.Bin490]|nr:MAG: hypothetical protein BWY84_01013 [Candidatus Aerophobetes bacterium ADurb.Bin490]